MNAGIRAARESIALGRIDKAVKALTKSRKLDEAASVAAIRSRDPALATLFRLEALADTLESVTSADRKASREATEADDTPKAPAKAPEPVKAELFSRASPAERNRR